MSTRCMSAVFENSHSKGNVRLVLLALADEANDEGLVTAYRRSQSWLAGKANADRETVRRAVAAAVELGELEVLSTGIGRASSDYRLLVPGIERPQTEGTQSEASEAANRGGRPLKVRGQRPQSEGSVIPVLPGTAPSSQEPAAAPTLGDRARVIANHVWDHRKPKPATRYIGAVKVFESLLGAGHADVAVQAAAMRSPTLTTSALEVQLSKANGRSNGRAPAPLDDDREGPPRRLHL